MNEWKDIELAKVIKTNLSSINRAFPYSEILYLDTGSITCNRISKLEKYELAKAPSRAKRLVKDLDLVYSCVRPNQLHYGIIRNPPKNLVVSTGFVVITCNQDELSPYYLFYFLAQKSTTEFLHSIAEGSTSAYPSIKPDDIEALEMPLPPIEEQKAIASVLSSLDDKINLLRRQNKTLEAMAETLFRQWFVEEADDSWEEGRLEDVVEHKRDGIDPSQYPDQLFAHYSIPAFDNHMVPSIESGTNIRSLKYKVHPRSIMVSKLNPRFPRIWPIDMPPEHSVCSTEFQVLVPKSQWYCFVYFFLKSQKVTDQLISAASGTSGSHQRIKPDDILNLQFIKPNAALLSEFTNLTSAIMAKVWQNARQIQTLERLRDTLLPKLMSGEVRVKV